MKAILLLIGVASLALTPVSASAAGLKIVAAENFYGTVAQQVAGSGCQVTSILSNPNQDPHEFTTNAATAKAVADADIVIYSGIAYDAWMDRLLGAEGKKGRTVIVAASLIGAKDGDNPHIWYDTHTMSALADRLAAALAQRDPAHAATYRQNAADFKASLQPVLDKIAGLKAKFGGATVTATEPVFGYMAKALGLKMVNYAFQVDVMNDTEPSVSETAAFEKSLTTKTAKVLFYNSQVTDPATDRIKKIAVASGVPIIGVTETQPPEDKTYVQWMLQQLRAVEAGLSTGNR
jgi:zinc/manganese transport system substrate-binding protein